MVDLLNLQDIHHGHWNIYPDRTRQFCCFIVVEGRHLLVVIALVLSEMFRVWVLLYALEKNYFRNLLSNQRSEGYWSEHHNCHHNHDQTWYLSNYQKLNHDGSLVLKTRPQKWVVIIVPKRCLWCLWQIYVLDKYHLWSSHQQQQQHGDNIDAVRTIGGWKIDFQCRGRERVAPDDVEIIWWWWWCY